MVESTSVAGASLWHPQAHMPSVPEHRVVMVRGEGAYLYTETGERLLDATASLWYCNVGHGRERLAEAAHEQMRRLETYHVFGPVANPPALELADRLAAMAPIDDGRVFLTSGGSDSVDAAAKLVRRYWQLQGQPAKTVILSRDKAYHGLHAFGTSLAGLGFNREGYGSESLVPETARVATNDPADLEATIATIGPDRIAAFFAEPVIGTGGVILPAPGYLEEAQRLCREHDILFVVDEVITGFGRTGRMFASERFDLSPDMLLFAKGVTSGYLPVGGLIAGPRLWSPFFDDPNAPIFRQGVTYSGHATACAVALANLDIVEEEGLVDRVAQLEGVLARAVAPLADHPLVADVRSGIGLLAGVQLAPGVPADEVARGCIREGVMMRPITDGTLPISPPFIVTEEEIGRIATTIGGVLDVVGAATTVGA